MRLPPEGLVTFAAVVEHGGVTSAARALSLSQPAVSNRLRALESLVGEPLFRRGPDGPALTPAGRRLLPHARAVAHALDRAASAVADDAAARRVVVAASEAAHVVAAPILASLAVGPDPVDVRVIATDGRRALELVAASRADVGVTVVAPREAGDGLERRPVLVDDIVLAVPSSSSLAEGPLPLRAIAGEAILWQRPGSGVRATASRALEAAGVWPAREAEVGSTLGVLSAVAAGAGVALVTRSSAAPWRLAGLVRTIDVDAPDLHARIEAVSLPLDLLGPAQARVLDALHARSTSRS